MNDIDKIQNKREEYLKEKNLKGLLSIAFLKWIKQGSLAFYNDCLPEICYYLGRLNDLEKLKEFIEENPIAMHGLPKETLEMGMDLFTIGQKFPHLEKSELDYLESLYTDSRCYQFMKYMMFDEDRLPRKIEKFDISKLSIRHQEFSDKLLIQVFNCFQLNEEIDDSIEDCYVYNRVKNIVLKKPYGLLSLEDFYINFNLNGTQFMDICLRASGEELRNHVLRKLKDRYKDDFEIMIEGNMVSFSPDHCLDHFKDFNLDESDLEKFKKYLSSDWLNDVNNMEIDF